MNCLLSKKVHFWKAIGGLSLFLLLFTQPAFSQSGLGRIYGSITDQTAGAIANSTVTVTDVARGIARPLVTDASGEYSAGSLIPGTYTVRAEATGFRAIERKDILLNVGGDVRVDLTLQPGEQTETITVTGELPMLNTSNAVLGGQIENTTINEIPLNGRNFLHLLDYKPGMISGAANASNTHSAAGQRTDANVWAVDGIYNGDLATGFPIINGFGVGGGPDPSTTLPLDAILEINLQQNPKAEYGYKPGQVVNVGLKSGTNTIHGSAYAFGRDKSFNTRNPFEEEGEKAPFAFTQWGANVGGPVKKDKLFYFGAIEKTRYNVSAVTEIPSPTSQVLGGTKGIANSIPDAIADIYAHSALPNQLSLNLVGCGTNGLVSSTPASLVGLTSAQIAARCNPDLSVFNNNTDSEHKVYSFPSVGGSGNYLVKMDYHHNDRHSFNGEWFIANGNTLAWTNNKSYQPYWRLNSDSRAQMVRGVWIWTPSSSLLNEARFGYDRLRANEVNNDCLAGPDWAADYGLSLGTGQFACAFPTVVISGFGDSAQNTLNIDQGDGPLLNISSNFSGIEAISWTRGSHQFKFGFEIHEGIFTGTGGGGPGPLPHGNLNFGTTTPFAGATSLQDFLTGTLTSGRVAAGSLIRDVTLNYYSGFVQDDWRLTPKITVNLGLRYEYVTPFRDKNNLLGNLDLTSPSGVRQQTDDRSIFNGDKNNFSPRIGVAWDVTGKGTTVVRVGASTLYSSTSWSGFSDVHTVPTGALFQNPDGSTFAGPGEINSAVLSFTGFSNSGIPNGAYWIANPAPNETVFGNFVNGTPRCGTGQAALTVFDPDGPGPLTSTFGGPTNSTTCSFLAIDPNLYTPYVTNWNLSLQQAIGSRVSLDLSYVGNHGTGLRALSDINQPAPGSKNATAEQQRRPFTTNCPVGTVQGAAGTNLVGGGCFPWLAQVRYMSNIDVSNYNAFQAFLSTRNWHGITSGIGYSYLRSSQQFTGNENVINNSLLRDGSRPRLDYGLTSVPWNVSATVNYNIPGKKGYGQMLEGWAVNLGIQIRPGGYADAVDTNGDYSGTGTRRDRWSIYGDPDNIVLSSFSGVPCFGIAGSRFAGNANCTTVATGTDPDGAGPLVANPVQFMPAACLAGAAGLQSGTNTGLQQLAAVGCYSQNGTAILAPAQGTFGNLAPGALTSRSDYRNVNLSVNKTWSFKERYSAQLRVEFFNVLNRTQFAGPTLNPNNASTFGTVSETPNAGNGIIIGGGGPRSMQLGLKLGF